VEKVVFRAPDGFTVARLRDKGSAGTGGKSRIVTVVSSSCPELALCVAGDSLECRGTWKDSAKWGRQLEVQASVALGSPWAAGGGDGGGGGGGISGSGAGNPDHSGSGGAVDPEEATRAWLLSGALPGVGPATAQRILARFPGSLAAGALDALGGMKTEAGLRESVLLQVPGLGLKSLAKVAEAVRQASGQGRRHARALCALGLPLDAATSVADYWGELAEAKVREDLGAMRVGAALHGLTSRCV
jgi:hypothetical protein